MTKYDNPYGNSYIVEIDETDYLVQGKVEDSLTMFREIDDLLECERDNVQKLMQEPTD